MSEKNWTGAKSAKRLRLVQHVIESAGVSDGALLVVPGPDGAYNVNSQRLLKYLFLGSSGEELLEPTISEEALEDCFLVILADRVKLYYGPAAAKLIGRLIASWPNLEEYRLLPGDFGGDAEKIDRFKIGSLVKMLASHNSVLLPTISVSTENHEMFPLVQAFALDEFKTGGFLSAVKDVRHMGDLLAPLWSHVDDEIQVKQAVKRLTLNWTTCVRLAARQVKDTSTVNMDLDDASSVFEPLYSFAEFAKVHPSQFVEKDEERHGGTQAIPLRNGAQGGGGGVCLRAEDPTSGIRLSRVYFWDTQEAKKELKLYSALVTAHRTALMKLSGEEQHDDETSSSAAPSFRIARDPSQARAARRMKAIMMQTLRGLERHVGESFDLEDDDVDVIFESFDLAGQACRSKFVDAWERIPLNALHFVEARVRVPGTDTVLWIGDTLVSSSETTVSPVTCDLPDLLCFSNPEKSLRIAGKLEYFGSSLRGRRKTPCTAFFGRNFFCAPIGQLTGHISFFERGIVFEHVGGKVLVDLSALESPEQLAFFNGAGATGSTAVLLNVDESLFGLDLDLMHTDLCTHMAFLVEGHTELSDAIHTYKEKGLVEFAGRAESQAMLRSFRASHLCDVVVVQDEQDLAENQECAESKFESKESVEKRNVFIIAGPPGSGKEAVAHAFARKWSAALLENDLIHAITFEPARLVKQLKNLHDTEDIVIVAPGDVAPETVLEVVHSTFAKNSVRVSAIGVVNAQNAYTDARKTNFVPGVFSCCSEGIVHTVVVSCTIQVPETELDHLQDRIRHWNTKADIFRVGVTLPENVDVRFDDSFWLHQEHVLEQSRTVLPEDWPKPRVDVESRVVYSQETLLSKSRFVFGLQRLSCPESFQAPVLVDSSDSFDLENMGAQENKKSVGIRRAQELAKKKVSSEREERIDKADIAALDLPEGDVFSVSGIVRFQESPNKYFFVSATNGVVRMAEAPTAALSKSQSKYTFGLLVEGRGFSNKLEFQAYFRALQPRVARVKPQLSSKSVPNKVLADLEKSLQSDDLPSGFWFDGRSYMDHTGVPLEHHPLLQERLEEWLATYNKGALSHNRAVEEAQQQRDNAKISCF